MQYNDDSKYVYKIVDEFHNMSVQLKKRTENVQNYIDEISTLVKDSSQGISNAASNTGNLSQEIQVIATRMQDNQEVADLLSKEAVHFITSK